jgi:hypothetical protein
VRGDKDDRESRSRGRNRNNNSNNQNNNSSNQQQQQGEDAGGPFSQNGSADDTGAANADERQQAQLQENGAPSPVRSNEAGSGPTADPASAEVPTEAAAAPVEDAEAPNGDAQPHESSAGGEPAAPEAVSSAIAAP